MMNSAIDDEQRLRLTRAAELLAAHNFKCWFFGDSIGFEALLAASEITGQERWTAFCEGYFRAWAARALPFRKQDNTAPGHAMCLCYARSGDRLILDGALRLAHFLTSRRQSQGVFVTFERTPLSSPFPGDGAEVELLRNPGAGIFVDCLHFDPSFFTHLGRLTSDESLVDLGVKQALGYVSLLQDEASGLFFHFWLEQTQARYILGWSRGQGWALLGLLDVIELLGRPDPRRERLIAAALRLCEGLRSRQLPDGNWSAVASDPASGPEASTTAFAATGFYRGLQLGILDPKVYLPAAETAWRAMWALTDSHGCLREVSGAVGASTVLSHYFHVPRGMVVPWGQGPLLLAATARSSYRAACDP